MRLVRYHVRAGGLKVSRLPRMMIVFFLVSSCAWAFQLVPMTLSLSPSGSDATGLFRVVNDTGSPIAVQVTVSTRNMDPDGTEHNEPAGSIFQVYPSQMIIPAGTTQSVRVRYVGPAVIDRERAFRFVAEQLPINLDRTDAPRPTVQFVLRYRATLYITPPDARANITGTLLEATEDRVEVEIRNSGSKHQLLDGSITFRNGSQELVVPMAEIDNLAGQNVLAGSMRRFVVEQRFPFVPRDVSIQAVR